MESAFGRMPDPNEAWLARAILEPALDPDLAIVDPHMHLWHRKAGHRYFVEDYARDVCSSGHTIEATVFVECNAMYHARGPEHLKCIGETEFAVGMSAIAASGKYTGAQVAAGIV